MAGHRTTRSRAPLSRQLLMRLAPVVEHEVRRYFLLSVDAAGRDVPIEAASLGRAAVQHALAGLFGGQRSTDERRTFFAFAAPLIRRAIIDYVSAGDVPVPRELDRPMLLKHWLARLESFDPQCVLMVDLHYFCGLGVRETAATIGCSVSIVLRDLRFAKRWLRAGVTWSHRAE